MSCIESVGKAGEGSTPPMDESAPKSPRRFSYSMTVCSLTVLGLLLVFSAVLTIRRSFDSSPAGSRGAELRAVSIEEVSGTDLLSTRVKPAQPQTPSPFRFAEIAREAGIDFVHYSGMTEERYSQIGRAHV